MNRSEPLPSLATIRSARIIVLLLCAYFVVLWVSLAQTADAFPGIVAFRSSAMWSAALGIACFALVSVLFAVTRFSVGYFVGFYFYTMIFGYLWLIRFSVLSYDHRVAMFSIIASCLAFLVPALFIASPVKRPLESSKQRFDLLPLFILLLAVATLAAGALYGFRPVAFSEMYKFRGQIQHPAFLRYATGITTNALLPFAFACFVHRKKYLWAAGALSALLLFYPITLTKLTLFAAPWLVFLVVLSRMFTARAVVILSLLLPVSVGIVVPFLIKSNMIPPEFGAMYVGTVNSRMIALPSISLDAYNEFFAKNPLTYFCQINLLKLVLTCPYDEPLSIVMSKAYDLGNLNASLFATEGIASVGPIFAPLSALGCGLIIGFANRLSFGLPATFVIVSAGMLPHVLLNVPLFTNLLSNGMAVLFLLWYITPRSAFGHEAPTSKGEPTQSGTG